VLGVKRTSLAPIGDRSGAVYVEFLLAFLPLFLFFSALLQLGMVQIADLVTKHAAVTAARAAIVVLTDDPMFYGGTPVNEASGARLEHIKKAAEIPLTAVAAADEIKRRLIVYLPDGPTIGEDQVVRVLVTFTYPCSIPVGNRLICGWFNGNMNLFAEAAMPNQGPNFEYSKE
jgi:hypothetical protein